MAPSRFRSPYSRLLALWILRAFSPALGRSSFLKDGAYADPDIAGFLGLPVPFDQTKSGAVAGLLDILQMSLERVGGASLSILARRNFAKLATAIKLNPVEERVLEFFACVTVEAPLSDTWRVLHQVSGTEPSRFISKVVGLPQNAVFKALSSSGRLMKCGLLKRGGHPLKRGLIEFHSSGLARRLLRNTYDPGKLLKAFGVVRLSSPELRLEDFPHLQSSLDLLLPYLKKVRTSRKSGVNVLVYGAPGTGKSQLVRVLGSSTDIPVFEVDTSDREGDPLSPEGRLSALNLAQAYFHEAPVLLVFDEAEDILTPSPSDRGMANSHKGWFNQMLEKNHQPIFWISNSISSLDPAFARRFDFILEVPIPPKPQRDRILRAKVGKLVSPGLIDRLAEMENLAPAVVTRARDVIQSIHREIPKGNRDNALTQVIGAILKAQGHHEPMLASRNILPADVYDIAHLNTSSNLRRMVDMLKNSPSARLCLHSPPGTGKTAFWHWLAAEIDRPIQVERGSDLFSPFVGMTEKAIARTFERAARDEAVLLLDEVDSFLQNRTHARNSWEITQINEMLTQIETFPGILIASTNFLDHLDPASLRRFDLKLHFGYLVPAQTRGLLVSYCRSLDLRAPDADDLAMAESLETATPGDFAAVARQHRFQPFKNALGLLQAVIAESEIKTKSTRKIGFQ